MLQGKVSKWQDLGFRSCGLIKVGKDKIYSVNASEVQPDEAGKRYLVVGEVVVFEPMPERVVKGKVYRTATKIIRPSDITREKEQAAREQVRQRTAHLEVQRQKDRAAERQKCVRHAVRSGGGYLKVILRDGIDVVFGIDEFELHRRLTQWEVSR
jgi:hypothetical protein